MSDTRRRVKVYTLNEDRQWDDRGTGHVSSTFVERLKGISLLVRAESDGKFPVSITTLTLLRANVCMLPLGCSDRSLQLATKCTWLTYFTFCIDYAAAVTTNGFTLPLRPMLTTIGRLEIDHQMAMVSRLVALAT